MNNSTSWKHWFASLPARTAAERDRRRAERARPPTAAERADQARLEAKINELMEDPLALRESPAFLAFMAGEQTSAEALWAGEAPPRHVCDDDTLWAIFNLLLHDVVKFDILGTWDPVTRQHGPTFHPLPGPAGVQPRANPTLEHPLGPRRSPLGADDDDE